MPRFTVDGHEYADLESNLAGDGQFPPFYIFDTVTQYTLPRQYKTRPEAESVAATVNAAFRGTWEK